MKNTEKLIVSDFAKAASKGMRQFLGQILKGDPKALGHANHAALNMGSRPAPLRLNVGRPKTPPHGEMRHILNNNPEVAMTNPGDVRRWLQNISRDGPGHLDDSNLNYLRQLMGGGEHADLQAVTRGAAADARAGARHQPNIDKRRFNKRRFNSVIERYDSIEEVKELLKNLSKK